MLSPARLFKLSTIVTILEQMMKNENQDQVFYGELLTSIETDFEQVVVFIQEELKRLKAE
jgi:hypothetical protein